MGKIKNLIYYKNYLKRFLISNLKVKININPHKKDTFLFKDIGILNPCIGSSNLGDQIIYEAVYKVLREIYPNDQFTNFPTQLYTSYDAHQLMNHKYLLFVSGTNLLSSNLESYNQWKINNSIKVFLKNKTVLVGCGWWQYQNEINSYTKDIYKTVFNKDVLHSVRDQYTVDKLKNIGIENVVNTTCPTLWEITLDKCKKIPIVKSENVITTLTSYHKNHIDDRKMLKILSDNYKVVNVWIQGMDDLPYLEEISENLKNIVIIPPTIEAYDHLLKNGNLDYIGTRLHAGVRALQFNLRTLIIAVDNRALEIGNDINLNVISRASVDIIELFINNEYITEINLPLENIEKWKNSFKNIEII